MRRRERGGREGGQKKREKMKRRKGKKIPGRSRQRRSQDSDTPNSRPNAWSCGCTEKEADVTFCWSLSEWLKERFCGGIRGLNLLLIRYTCPLPEKPCKSGAKTACMHSFTLLAWIILFYDFGFSNHMIFDFHRKSDNFELKSISMQFESVYS